MVGFLGKQRIVVKYQANGVPLGGAPTRYGYSSNAYAIRPGRTGTQMLAKPEGTAYLLGNNYTSPTNEYAENVKNFIWEMGIRPNELGLFSLTTSGYRHTPSGQCPDFKMLRSVRDMEVGMYTVGETLWTDTYFDFTQHPQLRRFYHFNINGLAGKVKKFDFTPCTYIEQIVLNRTHSEELVGVAGKKWLRILEVSPHYDGVYGQLKQLDVTGCESLERIQTAFIGTEYGQNPSGQDFELIGLTPLQNLTSIGLAWSKLASIDLGSKPKLLYLYLNGNKMTSIDASGCPKVQYFYGYHNSALTSVKLPEGDQMKYLYFYNTGLTGDFISELQKQTAWTYLHLESCPGITGNFPSPPLSATTVLLSYTSITGLPADFNNVEAMYWYSCKGSGTIKINKPQDIRMSAASSSSGIVLDFSAAPAGNYGRYSSISSDAGGVGITELKLPTTPGATLGVWQMSSCPNLAPIVWPNDGRVVFRQQGDTWPGIATTLTMQNCGTQNYVFPVGTSILSDIVVLETLGMGEEAVNGTVDNLLDNIAKYETVRPKDFSLAGNPGSITNSGNRPYRLAELQSLVLSHNFRVTVKFDGYDQSNFKIAGIVPVAGTSTDIIIQLGSAPHIGHHTNQKPDGLWYSNLLNIAGQTGLNGEWRIVSWGTDTTAVNQAAYATYWKLRRTGFDNSTLVNEPGIYQMRKY